MKKNVNTGTGDRIRTLRTGLKMSREAFAEQIGISVTHLAAVEKGERNMSTATLEQVCDALSVSADYLMFGRSEKANPDLIIEMLSNLDQDYVDYAKDLLKTYILAVGKAKRGTS